MAVRSKDWIAAFWKSDRALWHEASAEVFTVGLISIFPLIFAGIASYFIVAINTPEAPNHFGNKIWQTIASGQLLFYAISAIATVIFYASRDFKKNFPLRLHYMILSLLFVIFAATIIGIDPTLQKLSIAQITWTSIGIYAVSTAMYWTILIFRSIDPDDFDASLRASEAETRDELRALRQSQ
jgi:hypothetical protein